MSKLRVAAFIIPFLALVIAAFIYFSDRTADTREEIIISIPYSQYIRNIDNNYYKKWLEEQTGLSITFNIVYENYSVDYLRTMFASSYVHSDAFFSFLSDDDLWGYHEVLQEFGEKGYIIPLNDFAEQSVYLNAIFEDYPEYDLRSLMTSPDGNIYFMPTFDPSIPERHFQVMWLNQRWLRDLGLGIPQTTDELRDVLYAFNARGMSIPLAGSHAVLSRQSYHFIINAFVSSDPVNSYLFMENGAVRFAPTTDEWREAMKYLHGLYNDGLINPFGFENYELATLANDPRDILGGFTSRSITDVIFPGNPEIINEFIHVAPIAGPDGARNATITTPLPRPAAVITSSCQNPEAVFRLLDLMLSEEAFLIGRYGEENVDWVRADITDIDFYGNRAAVRVINHLKSRVQNKHINEMGPFFAYPAFADGVTFLAFDTSYEYKNARAYRVYERYKPDEHIRTAIFHNRPDIQSLRRDIDAYTEESIEAFITGTIDPFDDTAWETHLWRYRELDVNRLINSVAEVLR